MDTIKELSLRQRVVLRTFYNKYFKEAPVLLLISLECQLVRSFHVQRIHMPATNTSLFI